MGSSVYEIFDGGAPDVTLGPTLLGTATAGDPNAKRTLTHPDSANFPPIVYPLSPNDSTNIDNVVLLAGSANTVLTLGNRQVVRQLGKLEDQIITEVWKPVGNGVLPSFFARLLYEYYVNPPAFDPVAQTYIQWAPADRSTRVYNVELYAMGIGSTGASAEGQFRWNDEFNYTPGYGDSVSMMEAFDAAGGGFFRATMAIKLKIVSEVV